MSGMSLVQLAVERLIHHLLQMRKTNSLQTFVLLKPQSSTGARLNMAKSRLALVTLGLSLLTCQSFAQSPAKVDFVKDVQPLLRDNCIDCHGPSKQKAGLRLDRRSSVLKAFSRRVVPNSSANSMVYHRLIGSEYGMQMPPKAALHPEQIDIVKA